MQNDTPWTTCALSSVSIGERPLFNFRFADGRYDIDMLGGNAKELQQLAKRREKKTAAGYGTEISSAKSKILVTSIKPGPSTNIL